MTARLALAVSDPNGWWAHHKEGFEDLVVGKAVTEYARENHVCVRSWQPGNWFHDR